MRGYTGLSSLTVSNRLCCSAEGDFGIAWGFIRANVVAAAYERGRDCLSRVISAVIRDPFHQYSCGNVGVRISGEAVGEAVALCET